MEQGPEYKVQVGKPKTDRTRMTFWKDDSGNSLVCQDKGAGQRGCSKGLGDKMGVELRECGGMEGAGGP